MKIMAAFLTVLLLAGCAQKNYARACSNAGYTGKAHSDCQMQLYAIDQQRRNLMLSLGMQGLNKQRQPTITCSTFGDTTTCH